MRRTLAALTIAILGLNANAADQIRIGFMSTLSGPSAALGLDIRDAFNLVVKNNGGKLGGLPAEVVVVDDQMNPDTGKQLTARLLKKDRVDVVTGIVFSNVMLAIAPSVLENQRSPARAATRTSTWRRGRTTAITRPPASSRTRRT
jgi:branched-chain amino acid transport system substrate-binding protein